MKEISLTATVRAKAGRGSARQARRDGLIPAVTYGPEIDPVSVAINAREFRAAMRSISGGSAIFNLDVNGKQNKAILREIQRDPVTSDVIHLDFLAISMNKPIHVSIPVHYIGTPIGVKVDGGIMQVTMRDLEISCLPGNLPEFVEVDVSELGIGESIHVKDIKIPQGDILADEHRTMVVISAPTVVKAATPAEGVVVEEGAEKTEAEVAEGAADTKAEADGKDKKTK